MAPESAKQSAKGDAERKAGGEQAAFRTCAQYANCDDCLQYEQRRCKAWSHIAVKARLDDSSTIAAQVWERNCKEADRDEYGYAPKSKPTVARRMRACPSSRKHKPVCT